MTLNNDTKTPGGTTGFSTSIGAVKRWEANAAYRAALRSCLHRHTCFDKKSMQHKDLTPARILRDESDVQAILNVLTDVFIPPYQNPLLSISTGIAVPADCARRIFKAYDDGKIAMDTFMEERLSDNAKKSFFDPIKKMNMPSFSMRKKKLCKTQRKIVTIESSQNLFSKISIIAQKRSIYLKVLFRYPLGSVPLSLAEADGTLKKTVKSALLHKIEANVEPLTEVPERCTFIVDGMAAVRQFKCSQLTYRDFAVGFLKQVLSMGRKARRIDVVFDTYMDNCIKDVERNRKFHGQLLLQQIVPNAVIKQWNLLLSSNENKNKLIEFIVKQWQKESTMVGDKILYANIASKAYKINMDGHSREPSLDSDQQEADTRLLPIC